MKFCWREKPPRGGKGGVGLVLSGEKKIPLLSARVIHPLDSEEGGCGTRKRYRGAYGNGTDSIEKRHGSSSPCNSFPFPFPQKCNRSRIRLIVSILIFFTFFEMCYFERTVEFVDFSYRIFVARSHS